MVANRFRMLCLCVGKLKNPKNYFCSPFWTTAQTVLMSIAPRDIKAENGAFINQI